MSKYISNGYKAQEQLRELEQILPTLADEEEIEMCENLISDLAYEVNNYKG